MVNKDGEMVFVKKVESGVVLDSKSFFKKSTKGSSLTERVEETCTTVTIYQYMDYYNVRENGRLEYSYTKYIGTRTEQSCEYEYYPEIRGVAIGSGIYKTSNSNPYNNCSAKCLIDIKEDVLLIPSCRSFEYAAGVSNGIPSKVAGVSNINNYFGTLKLRSDGTWRAHAIELNITKAYFIMPITITNGRAANLTAKALRAANFATKAWYLSNSNATKDDLIRQWDRNINIAMNGIGGYYTKSPSFTIRSLAPYLEDFSWLPADCE